MLASNASMCEYYEPREKIMNEEKFVPHVIEPSFGISRILYSVLEHSFRMRDEKRTFLALPPWIAPVKCSILTVIALPEFEPFTKALRINLITIIMNYIIIHYIFIRKQFEEKWCLE